ncbi:uncharacterized protein [Diadema antillarum]|uniref:uncharacterized protein n=1 Tax=Diadema antillarum TaxID=105358 RepID=UPI003A89C0FB
MSMLVLLPFDPHSDSASLSQRWEQYIKRFEGAMVGFNITTPKRKRALHLHYRGELLQNVFDTLPDTGTENDYEKARDALKAHFVPQKNIVYETILFRRLTQQPDENVAQFCTQLRKEIEKCQFADVERELLTQIITGCRSGQMRRRALEKQISLKELLDLARSIELSQERADGVKADTSSKVHRVSTQHKKKRSNHTGIQSGSGKTTVRQKQKQGDKATRKKKSEQCGHCGYAYPHSGECHAKGKRCNTCNKLNHFASVCRSGKPVQYIDSDDNAEPHSADSTNPRSSVDFAQDYVFSVSMNKPLTHVDINRIPCSMIIDTGCSRNIIDENTFKKLNMKLRKTSIKLFPYGASKPLTVLGTFTGLIETPRKTTVADICVVQGSAGCLLGLSTAQELNKSINP